MFEKIIFYFLLIREFVPIPLHCKRVKLEKPVLLCKKYKENTTKIKRRKKKDKSTINLKSFFFQFSRFLHIICLGLCQLKTNLLNLFFFSLLFFTRKTEKEREKKYENLQLLSLRKIKLNEDEYDSNC